MPRLEGFPWNAQNCVIAVALYPQKQKEIIYIGERTEIKKKIAGRKDAKLYVQDKRPLGTFLFDCMDRFPDIREFMSALSDPNSYMHKEAVKTAEDCFYSDNLGKCFMAIRLWQQIQAWDNKPKPNMIERFIKKEQEIDESTYLDWMERLTLPFNVSFFNLVSSWQNENPPNPLEVFEEITEDYIREGFTFPALSLAYTRKGTFLEFAIANSNIMPLMLYYLTRLYDMHLYIRKCTHCNALFLSNHAKREVLCSDSCRAEKGVANKQSYDKEKREKPYEKEASAAYMYWYKRVEKIRKQGDFPADELENVELAFEEYKKENRKKKAQVKKNNLPEADYIKWLKTQRYEISKLVDKDE